MNQSEILKRLAEGATLERPDWTKLAKVLSAEPRGSRVQVQAVGLHTKRLWSNLLTNDDFDGAVEVNQARQPAALDGDAAHFHPCRGRSKAPC
jgi:hypothetical protein